MLSPQCGQSRSPNLSLVSQFGQDWSVAIFIKTFCICSSVAMISKLIWLWSLNWDLMWFGFYCTGWFIDICLVLPKSRGWGARFLIASTSPSEEIPSSLKQNFMGWNRPLQVLTIEGIVLPKNYYTLGLAYPKHLGSAIRACALGSRSAILHSYLLGILDFSTSSTLHTISLHFLLLNRF